MLSEKEVLKWILEDSPPGSNERAVGKLLLLRLAMSLKDEHEALDVTRSVELSLGEFERGNLLRVLRNLSSKGMILIVDDKGVEFAPEQLSTKTLEVIEMLVTERGRLEAGW